MTPALYRALLRLYPASFRADYAPELERAYVELVRERGRIGAMLFALGDVVPNAIAAHAEVFRQDLRYTLRSLAASRGFALTTILITALGVGANTATFSIADFVLVRQLAFPRAEELVRVCEGTKGPMGWGCMNQLSPALYRDLATGTRSFEAFGVFQRSDVNLSGSGEPVRIPASGLTSEVLPLLGVTPTIGRLFDARDAASVDIQSIVISHGLWQSQFGGDARVVGKTVNLDGTQFTIVGVMPPSFRFPTADVQLWMPRVFREDDFSNRGNSFLDGVARLRPGVTFEQARAELATIAARLERDHPDAYKDFAFSFFLQRDEMSPRYGVILWSLCGASLCLLLLACANLANLMLARAAGRERELAIRAALGAGRERLVRQMLTESTLLAIVGGAAGALVAWLAVPMLSRLVPSTLPMDAQPSLDLRFFGFAMAFAALTGLLFGVMTARRASGSAGFAALRDGARGSGRRERLRMVLVATEVAMSAILLVSSGLLIRAILRVNSVSPGFTAAETVLSARTALPSPKYDDRQRRLAFYDRVLSDVRALPGVEAAAYMSGLPMVMTGGITTILLPGEGRDVGRRDANRTASFRIVSSGFFATLGIPIRAGRDVGETDTRERALVAVVSESFAKRYWPGADPIGKVFQTRNESRTVVGVVADIRVRGLERTSEPQMYIPVHQTPDNIGFNYPPKDLVVRSSADETALVPAIRRIVRSVDAEQPVSDVRVLADVLADQTMTRRTQISVLGALAALALLLAGVGIHGLLSFTVAQRDREIGVRLALGAAPALVGRMVVSEAVRMALLGVVPGLLVAYAAARAMSTLLFGVRPEDPLTIAAVGVVCFLMVAAGCARPAWRAMRIDPITALRSD